MTLEQLEKAISNMQLAEVERYNELKGRIETLKEAHAELLAQRVDDFEKRIKTLEEARQRQIQLNNTFQVKPQPAESPKINLTRNSFWDLFR